MYSIDYNTRMYVSEPYTSVIDKIINEPDRISINRKGEELYEKFNVSITFINDHDCYFNVRKPSLKYFDRELKWYASGSLAVEDAMECSKFWANCTDDGKTVNSNYGYLLFHKSNTRGLTQFEHAANMLLRSLSTKKAVMVLYDSEHAYMSNDNPCTMFIEFHVVYRDPGHNEPSLDMSVYMRSSDIWFGLPYDVPFFRTVQHAMHSVLITKYPKMRMGYYVHSAANMHVYSRDVEKLRANMQERLIHSSEFLKDYTNNMVEFRTIMYEGAKLLTKVYEDNLMTNNVNEMDLMAAAWKESEKSTCLKKHCGAVIANEHGVIIARGFGAKYGTPCKECMRDKGEKFYGDGCWSVHAETRCIMDFMNYVGREYSEAHAIADDMVDVIRAEAAKCTVYVTHGPCDACLKFLDFYGFKNVVYDIPYKTDYEGHWPNITVRRLRYTANGDELGKYAPGKGPKCC